MAAAETRRPHQTHAKDRREHANTVGPPHPGHGHGAGGRHHAHPHSRLQYQKRSKNPPARTPTAFRLRHWGQVVEVGTFGLYRGTRLNGQRRYMRNAPAAGGAGRLGLVGMRERAELAGGDLVVESEPGAGTAVLARFPLSSR
jgi:hypothetical protein